MARLEETLAGQIAEARLDSSGRFTLDLSKALEKLAAYQLPGSYTWACKLVQAAVAAGCQGVKIRLHSQGCEFRLEGSLENVSWEDFESTLLDPRSTGNRAWDHLKQGLWSVLRESGRPFSVTLAGWERAWLWTGLQGQAGPAGQQNATESQITVWHRQVSQGSMLSRVSDYFQSARRNAGIAQEIQTRCCACPIPLNLDGRRMDALQRSPQHGLSTSSYPFLYGFLSAPKLPQLGLPQATLQAQKSNGRLKEMAQQGLEAPARFSVAGALVAHVKKPPMARHYKPASQLSHCYWVQDGVIVDVQPFELAAGCCSLAVFANAEGLETDLSGMKLQKNRLYQKRLVAVAKLLDSWLQQSEPKFERLMHSVESAARKEGALVFSVGAGFSCLTAHPVVLIPSALAALVFYAQYKDSTDKPAIAQAVTKAFHKLQTDWPGVVRSLRASEKSRAE